MNNWDQLTPRKVRKLQDAKLRGFIRDQVYPFSTHYRELMDCQGIDPCSIRTVADLRRLPFTSKADLLPTPERPERPRDFLLLPDPKILRRRPGIILNSLVYGRRRIQLDLESEYQPLLLTSTTGRSAAPVPFLYTRQDTNNLRTAGGRVIDLGNGTREDRILNLFPYAPHLAYWVTHYAAHSRNIFSVGTGGGKVLGTTGNLDLMEKIRPTILVGMPTFLYHLLRQGATEKRRLENLRCIVFGGEKVAPGTRRKLASLVREMGAGDITTLATYGFTEAKLAFPECATPAGESPTGYHLFPDLGIVEIIDPNTGEVLPEGHGGEIVFTPLQARGTIVLRYRTGDLAEGGVIHEPCPRCGRNVPRLIGRISRVSGIHSMQLQKVKGTLVDFNELEHMLDEIEDIGTWQLEIRKTNDDPMELDQLILHVSLAPTASPDHLARKIEERFLQTSELRPNAIRFHSEQGMRKRHGVGTVIKEERILDNRPKGSGTKSPDGERSKSRPRRPRTRSRKLHDPVKN